MVVRTVASTMMVAHCVEMVKGKETVNTSRGLCQAVIVKDEYSKVVTYQKGCAQQSRHLLEQ